MLPPHREISSQVKDAENIAQARQTGQSQGKPTEPQAAQGETLRGRRLKTAQPAKLHLHTTHTHIRIHS